MQNVDPMWFCIGVLIFIVVLQMIALFIGEKLHSDMVKDLTAKIMSRNYNEFATVEIRKEKIKKEPKPTTEDKSGVPTGMVKL